MIPKNARHGRQGGPKSSKVIGRHLWTFPYGTESKIEVLVLFIGNYFE